MNQTETGFPLYLALWTQLFPLALRCSVTRMMTCLLSVLIFWGTMLICWKKRSGKLMTLLFVIYFQENLLALVTLSIFKRCWTTAFTFGCFDSGLYRTKWNCFMNCFKPLSRNWSTMLTTISSTRLDFSPVFLSDNYHSTFKSVHPFIIEQDA